MRSFFGWVAGIATIAAGVVWFTPLNTRADTIYVSDYGNGTGNGRIIKFDANGTSSVFASGFDFPAGLALDSTGNLFATAYYGVPTVSGGYRIEEFTPAGDGSVFVASRGGISLPGDTLYGPRGLAFDSFGNLYVANRGGYYISKIFPNGVGFPWASVSRTGGFQPEALAFDSAGNLYATSYRLDRGCTLEKFDAFGNWLGTFANLGFSVEGLALDSEGNLYVSESSSDTITKFTVNGVGTVFADASDGLSSPRGLAFDSNGNLYVCNAHSIQEFTPNGVGSTFATTGAYSPYYAIAIQPSPVPEPSTWAMLAAGAGFLFALRRRNASPSKP